MRVQEISLSQAMSMIELDDTKVLNDMGSCVFYTIKKDNGEDALLMLNSENQAAIIDGK